MRQGGTQSSVMCKALFCTDAVSVWRTAAPATTTTQQQQPQAQPIHLPPRFAFMHKTETQGGANRVTQRVRGDGIQLHTKHNACMWWSTLEGEGMRVKKECSSHNSCLCMCVERGAACASQSQLRASKQQHANPATTFKPLVSHSRARNAPAQHTRVVGKTTHVC